MGNEGSITVKGWAVKAIVAAASIVVAVAGILAGIDTRYVKAREHEEHEANDKQEVARIDRTLLNHIEATRLDAVRLSVIEQQLATIQRQLEIMDAKLDVAAARKPGLLR